VISADGVTVRYSGVPALRDVSIALRPGTIHALAGENGAGKSTLMRVLAGARVPDGGTIVLAGVPVQFRTPRDAHRALSRFVVSIGRVAPVCPMVPGPCPQPFLLSERSFFM